MTFDIRNTLPSSYNHVDRQYMTLLHTILEDGVDRPDRTGTGVRSTFGAHMKFDLSKGFPLLTTKKMHTTGMIEELLWFLRGDTNVNTLAESAKKWWQPWASENGDLGPIYGEQLRRSRWWFATTPKIFDPFVPEPSENLFYGYGDLASTKKTHCNDRADELLKPVWRDMIKRCYVEQSKGYKSYGAKGVHMDPKWLHYPSFKEDATNIDGWPSKLEYPDNYSLDKDIKFYSNRYSKETCIWATDREQKINNTQVRPLTAIDPEGKEHVFASIGDTNLLYNLNISAVHRCLNGKLKSHHGWHSFKYIEMEKGSVLRFREIDQVANAVAQIKHTPWSRRILINLWHTPAMTIAALPCCHGSVIQFFVENDRLSCLMYQRSADTFIGVPVNIASYSLLTMMMAQVCDLKPGKFIHTLGDAHIYSNHFSQVNLQLSREPRSLPTMKINPDVKDIFSFTLDDFTLEGYDPHPAIKAPVAV